MQKPEIWGSPCWADGKVYIGTGDGDIHILEHGKTMKVRGKSRNERRPNLQHSRGGQRRALCHDHEKPLGDRQ